MKTTNTTGPRASVKLTRCGIYTRKSTEEGLDQEYNSLDAQRDAGEAYVRSQAGEGWVVVADRYDDGGRTGRGGFPYRRHTTSLSPDDRRV